LRGFELDKKSVTESHIDDKNWSFKIKVIFKMNLDVIEKINILALQMNEV